MKACGEKSKANSKKKSAHLVLRARKRKIGHTTEKATEKINAEKRKKRQSRLSHHS